VNNEIPRVTSTAQTPDLDWSQVRETVRMLQVAVGQIQVAMREGSDSVETLSGVFTSMMGSIKQISESMSDLEEANVELTKEMVEASCNQVESQIHGTIVAFQFYDRLSQRLGHVTDSLSSLSDLVGDQSRLYSPDEWKGLQQKIRSRYNMEEELEMFDAVLSGVDIKEAIGICFDKRAARLAAPEDDIELF